MGFYTLNERKDMKLSDKAKKNFVEDNEFYIHIGKKIKEARLEREIFVQNLDDKINVDGYYIKKPATQSTLAKALKTTFQQIGKYEKGQNRIPIVNLIRICKFLNKPLDYFLDIDKETMIQSFIAKMNNEMHK
jgi:transcriptional regulator with XRE-family HTH domain